MNVLDIVDKVNVLSRLEIIAGSLWQRRSPHEIRVSRYGHISGNEAARILRKRGVRVWGTRALSDWFVLHVSREQAKWAESILLTAGCSLEKMTAGVKPMSKLPTPWGETRNDNKRGETSIWKRIKEAIDE